MRKLHRGCYTPSLNSSGSLHTDHIGRIPLVHMITSDRARMASTECRTRFHPQALQRLLAFQTHRSLALLPLEWPLHFPSSASLRLRARPSESSPPSSALPSASSRTAPTAGVPWAATPAAPQRRATPRAQEQAR